ncbi:putative exported protein [Ligilactobacillus hayakitensis DSM 18933 = JCM 14209]|uniref:Putative exported protein n=3 Tax=Ligilactobacillus TaxID=2767887 RepID=A0A0R1WRU5_9LACO|nr:putative exported protein [Ligilactobacillus hayakitensis DSM 18933 = JCM 14209]
MQYGQQKINGSWYFFDKNSGRMKTGFQEIKGQNKTVYYNTQGKMQYGQQYINGSWYLFDEKSGAMKTGFQEIKDQNKTVYYNNQGKMQYGLQKINGKEYYFDKFSGAMATGKITIDGKTYDFSSNVQNTWGWPFPSIGQGSFTGAQLFGVNPGGGFRTNGFHDGLDFGSYDHPGSSVHAVHGGTVTRVSYTPGLEHYVVVKSDDGYNIVYQEAFSNRGNIKVSVGQKIKTGDVIGYRNTSHLHLGITREQNIDKAIANSFNNNDTWLNPLSVIKNGIANQK